MSNSDRLDAAANQLSSAMSQLETRVSEVCKGREENTSLYAMIDALTAERDELKAELAKMNAHAGRLEATNKEVASKLDTAIDSIRTVLTAT